MTDDLAGVCDRCHQHQRFRGGVCAECHIELSEEVAETLRQTLDALPRDDVAEPYYDRERVQAEAYRRGAKDALTEIYERLRWIRNESAGRIVTVLETEIERGEWPLKGGDDGKS